MTFTPKEQAILHLVIQGFTAKEIGEALLMSHRTVEKAKEQIMDKAGCRNIAHAIYNLAKQGVI